MIMHDFANKRWMRAVLRRGKRDIWLSRIIFWLVMTACAVDVKYMLL